MEQLDEILQEFLVESYENLDQLDRDLLELEEVPDDCDRLASVFRTIHSIKGASGFLALSKLERLTHVGESLLVPLRDGEIRLNNEIATALLQMVDAVRNMLGTIETTGEEGEEDYAELVGVLEKLQNQSAPAANDSSEAGNEQPATDTKPTPEPNDSPTESSSAPDKPEPTPTQAPEASNPAAESPSSVSKADGEAPEPAPLKVHDSGDAADSSNAKPPEADQESTYAETVAAVAAAELKASDQHTPATTPPVASTLPPIDGPNPAMNSPEPQTPNSDAIAGKSGVQSTSSPKPNSDKKSVADKTLRVDVEILDNVMNLVGELVLSRNQVLQFSKDEDSAVNAALQKLNHVTTELQEAVMKTRMQPIRNVWSKLPRVVRDLSNLCGKKVQVEMEGADTELDKTVLEAIKDPLTHVVRNSVDHGIETPEERKTLGKPEAGTLSLRAFHEGGQVNIEIADNGRGLDLERIRQKAIDRGIITLEQAATMHDREVISLILLPGFSTAAKVTNVSGRGVGMDVVKTNIESIGGTLDVQSVSGQGTTLRIKLPLTLAIVPALIVRSLDQSFAIPQVNLLELVRLDRDRAAKEIEYVYGTPVCRLRGNLLPILYLDEILELRTPEERREREIAEDQDYTVNIVVLQAEDRQFGLVVDAITDTQEIVVKPLDQFLKGIGTFSGATIMGNGSVSLILDAIGMAQQGKILSDQDNRTPDNLDYDPTKLSRRESWLLVDPGDGNQAAIRLDGIARLEEFANEQLELIDNRTVVQYRGQIMPIIDVNGHFQQVEIDPNREAINVVVYNDGTRNIGVIVHDILDILDEPRMTEDDPQSVEQKVIGGRVTKVVWPTKLQPREADAPQGGWLSYSALPEIITSQFTSK